MNFLYFWFIYIFLSIYPIKINIFIIAYIFIYLFSQFLYDQQNKRNVLKFLFLLFFFILSLFPLYFLSHKLSSLDWFLEILREIMKERQ